MSDSTVFDGFGQAPAPDESADQSGTHHPKHRLEGVPVDGESSAAEVSAESIFDFGQNPDTELAG